MADEKIYYPETIGDIPFPQEGVQPGGPTQSSSSGVQSPEKITDQNFPQKRVAVELLSVTLNTKTKKILAEYKFSPSGAIQIGELIAGISGDLRISPDGIVARNSDGDVTFALDGTDGSATFAGEIKSGSVVTGIVTVGDGNIQIDGQTRRILFYDANGIPNIIIGSVS